MKIISRNHIKIIPEEKRRILYERSIEQKVKAKQNPQKINLPANTPETHFVYVWVNTDGNALRDLQTSVRSVRKFFYGKPTIFIVGDTSNIKKVNHINTTIIKNFKQAKAIDAAYKLKLIAENTSIHNDFVYIYDDIIFLKIINYKTLSRIIANDYVNDYKTYFVGSSLKPDPRYLYLFNKTHDLLIKHNLPQYNYETHLPRVLNKQRVLELIDKFDLLNQPLLFNTLYFNYYCNKPEATLRDNIPDYKFGAYWPRSELTISEGIKKATFLNYNDAGLNDELKTEIRKTLQ